MKLKEKISFSIYVIVVDTVAKINVVKKSKTNTRKFQHTATRLFIEGKKTTGSGYKKTKKGNGCLDTIEQIPTNKPLALFVKVIQAFDLKALDSNGLSDPYCALQIDNQKKTTSIIANVAGMADRDAGRRFERLFSEQLWWLGKPDRWLHS